jgi:hypothetical protein
MKFGPEIRLYLSGRCKKNKMKAIKFLHGIGILSLFLIILQSYAIRYYQGIGITISLLLLLLNFTNLIYFKTREWIFTLSALILLNVTYIITGNYPSVNYIILQITHIINAILILVFYRRKKMDIVHDFMLNLTFLFWIAFISYVLYLLIPSIFHASSDMYLRFGVIFNVIPGQPFPRATGLFWEPGVMSLAVNWYLFLSIIQNAKWSKLLLISLGVIITLSTTGYIVMLINWSFFFIIKKKVKIIHFIFAVLIILTLYPVVRTNYRAKMQTTSGYVRERDILVGLEILQKHPLFGLGVGDTKLIEQSLSREFMQEQDVYWGKSYSQKYGYFAAGYTNGLLGLFIRYGIPISILLYWGLFYNIFGQTKIQKYGFALIFLVSSIGEPITDTPFFLLLAFSGVILQKGTNG